MVVIVPQPTGDRPGPIAKIVVDRVETDSVRLKFSAPTNAECVQEIAVMVAEGKIGEFVEQMTLNTISPKTFPSTICLSNLQPNTEYMFVLQMVTVNGQIVRSLPTEMVKTKSEHGLPGKITEIRVDQVGADFVRLRFEAPENAERVKTVVALIAREGDNDFFMHTAVGVPSPPRFPKSIELFGLQAATAYRFALLLVTHDGEEVESSPTESVTTLSDDDEEADFEYLNAKEIVNGAVSRTPANQTLQVEHSLVKVNEFESVFAPERLCEQLKERSELVYDTEDIEIYRPAREEEMIVPGVHKYAIGMQRLEDTINEKTILMVGGTGSGKTTLINGMVNYLYDVQSSNPYRFKLISIKDEEEEAGGGPLQPGQSRTKTVTAYVLNGTKMQYRVTLVDTPGFGDTEGLDQDMKTIDYIKEWFRKGSKGGIVTLNAICIVLPATQSRLSAQLRHELNSVISLFGKDMKENIMIMFTFCDGRKPPGYEALKAAEIVYSDAYKFNNSAIFDSCLASTAMTDDEDQAAFQQFFWKMGMNNYDNFFEKGLKKLRPKSLAMSCAVLEYREQLQIQARALYKQMQYGIVKVQEISDLIKVVFDHQADIDRNKNFDIPVTVTVPKKVDIGGKGEMTTNCLKCNFTCHRNCCIAKDEMKKWCSIMKTIIPHRQDQLMQGRAMDPRDGDINKIRTCYKRDAEQDEAQEKSATCLVCPGKCHWKEHHNVPYYIEYVEEQTTKTVDSMMKSYRIAKSEKERSHKLLEKMAEDFAEKEKAVARLVSEIRGVLNKLSETALLPQYLTDVEYLKMMIEAQRVECRKGYGKRIEVLNRHLKIAELIQKVQNANANILDEATDRECLNYLQKTFPHLFKDNAGQIMNDDQREPFKDRLKKMLKPVFL